MLLWLNQYFAHLGYFVVALAMLAEGLTLPCPAVLVLLMAGAATKAGRLSYPMTIVIATSAYSLGALLPYYLGRNLSRLESLPWVGRLIAKSLKALEETTALFRRHGEITVALSRPFWIGNLVSYFAGISGMGGGRFFLYTLLGILPWSMVVTLLGQAFSSNLPKAMYMIRHYSEIGMGLLIFSAFAAWLYVKYRQRHPCLPLPRK